MRSPRTVQQREWLIRMAFRIVWPHEIQQRTLAALKRGGWVSVGHNGTVALAAKGREWIQAFKDGTKWIGGAK